MKLTLRTYGTDISWDENFKGDINNSRLEGSFSVKGRDFYITVMSVPTFRRLRAKLSRFHPSLKKPVLMSYHNGLYISITEKEGEITKQVTSVTKDSWDYEKLYYTKEIIMWEVNLNMNLSGEDRIKEIEILPPPIKLSRNFHIPNMELFEEN